MSFKKLDVTLVMIIMVFIPLLFLSKIIDLIPSKRVSFIVQVIVFLLVIIFAIFITYNDLKKSRFTTTIYIFAADMAIVISLIVLGYVSFKDYSRLGTDILIHNYILNLRIELFLFIAMILRSVLTNERIRKNFH